MIRTDRKRWESALGTHAWTWHLTGDHHIEWLLTEDGAKPLAVLHTHPIPDYSETTEVMLQYIVKRFIRTIDYKIQIELGRKLAVPVYFVIYRALPTAFWVYNCTDELDCIFYTKKKMRQFLSDLRRRSIS